MKRDMELARRMLLKVEEADEPVPYEEFASEAQEAKRGERRCLRYRAKLEGPSSKIVCSLRLVHRQLG